MNTKNFFKTLACAMLMPAVLLTTSCSKGDDAVTNPEKPTTTEAAETAVNKGYALPVTVNVTRQDDGTRATYNESTKKLEFSAGDKLFVNGFHDEAGLYAGTLDYDTEKKNFSGTIYTQNEYSGTADDLFSAASEVVATLLPYGYDSYTFLSISEESPALYVYTVIPDGDKAFVASETAKATGVEQLSYERATTYSSGFALAPMCAILNFTISGLEAGAQDVTLYLTHTGAACTVTGSVTPNASGVATFAIGVPGGFKISDGANNLTVGSHKFTLPGGTALAAGKIYNITRVVNGINGKFTINSSGDQVYFSKGNLRYVSSKWSFFDNQYDYYTSYSANAWDKFGWSTSATTYGMNTSASSSAYYGDFVDWGATMGTGWFTLSKAEWTYLFNGRSASTVGGTSNVRYAKAKVNDVQGIILFPDTYTHPDGVTAPTGVNATGDTGWNGNNYSSADWTKMESAGCVFLPAAGRRNGTTLENVGSSGLYWSATANDENTAYSVYFVSDYLVEGYNSRGRNHGCSVRLVRNAN